MQANYHLYRLASRRLLKNFLITRLLGTYHGHTH